MEEKGPEPANQGEPVPATLARDHVPQVVVNCGAGRVRRVLTWLGWFAFAISLMILIGQSMALRQYFRRSEGVRERYYSGAKHVREKVAIISVTGAIMDGEPVRRQINHALEDDHVKAVVVRIVSPGGTITGSDYIRHHLEKLREEKDIPLVVSMGGIAASGGYYVAMAVGDQPDTIFAEPMTTTGSIGVVIPYYDVSGLLQRFDIQDESLASHPNKRMLSMTHPLTDEQREILESYLGAAMTRFKDVIQRGRPMFRQDSEALEALATGEIFTAEQALEFGLVDEIGFLEAAIDRALEMAGLDEETARVVEYYRPATLLDLPFSGPSAGLPRGLDLATWFELNTPQAYYLASTLPMLANGQ